MKKSAWPSHRGAPQRPQPLAGIRGFGLPACTKEAAATDPDDSSDADGDGASAEDAAALPCLCAGQLTHDAGTDREYANNGACP